MMAQAEIERQQGITPEVKRLDEVRGGVVTTFVGLGIMIFLYFFLGIIAAMIPNPGVARLIDHIWLAGIIPFLVGIAITFNGLIVSKRIVELKRAALQGEMGNTGTRIQAELPERSERPAGIDAPTTSAFDKFSVTESTTTHLGERVSEQHPRDRAAQPEQQRQTPPGSQERSSTH